MRVLLDFSFPNMHDLSFSNTLYIWIPVTSFNRHYTLEHVDGTVKTLIFLFSFFWVVSVMSLFNLPLFVSLQVICSHGHQGNNKLLVESRVREMEEEGHGQLVHHPDNSSVTLGLHATGGVCL